MTNSLYIGWTDDKATAEIIREVLAQHGVRTQIIKRTRQWPFDPDTHGYSLKCLRAEDTLRAREIKRGFKVGLGLVGDPIDFMLGVRAACLVRKKNKSSKLPTGGSMPLLTGGS